MKKVMVFLDDETGDKLERLADRDYRSVKAMAEKILRDSVSRDVNRVEQDQAFIYKEA